MMIEKKSQNVKKKNKIHPDHNFNTPQSIPSHMFNFLQIKHINFKKIFRKSLIFVQ